MVIILLYTLLQATLKEFKFDMHSTKGMKDDFRSYENAIFLH